VTNTLHVYSQDDYKFLMNFSEGYIIKNDGEKIKCYIEDKPIKIINFHPNKIKYKLNSRDKKNFIKIKDIKEYKCSGYVYQKISLNNHEFFAEKILQGKISLYSQTIKYSYHTMSSQGMPTGYYSNESTTYYIMKNSKVEKVPKSGFVEFMLLYVGDNEKLATELRSLI
jgi:hypothetical protein